MTPALISFGLFGLVTFSAYFAPAIFYWLTAYLTIFSMGWISMATIFTFVSYLRTREATKKDWQAMLEEVQQVDPDGSSVLHIVILPNYKENEGMLKETLENLGRSPLASTRIRVVLGMEAREGPAAHEKANRLVQQTQHLFADIFATFHPGGLPGEVAGKSSNTQWAYREALRHYGPILLGYDNSRVFVTISDADTLWHPQYFSAVTYSGLMMSSEERVWRIWQPPVLLARNHFKVPMMTRASGMATIIFEMFGLSCPSTISPAFAFSSYSLTLAMATHPEVDGWDVDVIAEDHHMFCKCFFAALWELAHDSKDMSKQKGAEHMEPIRIEPQVQVEPIYLPAVSFLVESDEGYWPSVMARFQQARRHIQGVVELGYILLQYARLLKETGFGKIPKLTHKAIILMAVKIYVLMIQTSAQTWAMVIAGLKTIAAPIFCRIWADGFGSLFVGVQQLADAPQAPSATQQLQELFRACLQQVTGVTTVMTVVTFLVLMDLMEGRFHSVLPPMPPTAMSLAEGDDDDDTHASGSEQASSPTGRPLQAAQSPSQEGEASSGGGEPMQQDMPSFVEGPLPLTRKLWLLIIAFIDLSVMGLPSVLFLTVFPLLMAAWSLLVRGTDFEYIVASKPG